MKAAQRNMYGKQVPVTLLKMPFNAVTPKKIETIPKDPPSRSKKRDKEEEAPSDQPPKKEPHRHHSVPPRSLYYSNQYLPKLADLRDAMRINQVFHNRFNEVLELPETKRYYAAALRQ